LTIEAAISVRAGMSAVAITTCAFGSEALTRSASETCE
jgi:hypothetical protein